MWITVVGLPPSIRCHSGVEGTKVDRLEKLEKNKVEQERMARSEADDTYVNLQPPTPPQEFLSTNLFQQQNMKTDSLPWAGLEHGGKEFEWRWNEFQKTKDSDNKMSDVTLWWFGKAQV